jgi:hypothetical protein
MMSRRFLADKIWLSLAFVAVAIAVIPLVSILYEVTRLGISSMNVDFFTKLPPTLLPGSVGGMGNAIEGSLMLIALASVIGLPVGLFSGIFISEYGNNWYGNTVRFLGDVLVGNPSIVIGILGYILLVLPFHGFSLVAGGVAAQLPLGAGGEARPTAPTQPGTLDLSDNLFGLHLHEHFCNCLIGAAGNGFVDVFRVDEAAIPKNDQSLVRKERYIRHFWNR